MLSREGDVGAHAVYKDTTGMTSHMMLSDFAVNKYLHTVVSGWIFINTELRCTEP